MEKPGMWASECDLCGWVEKANHLFQSECTTDECPECGSDEISDRNYLKEENYN